MSLWDDLPGSVRNAGALDGARPILSALAATGPDETSDADGAWQTWTIDADLTGPLSLDPGTGAFGDRSGTGGTPFEFPDPHVVGTFSLHRSASGADLDGGWRLLLTVPALHVRMPFLRGAKLDGDGHLVFDPDNAVVRFVVPRIRVRVQQFAGQAVAVDLLSLSTGPDAPDQIYDFVRMEPPYALCGPQEVVGFAFRSAVLDLSGTAGLAGVPAEARAMPSAWQGFYLPDARLFVAPPGLELSIMAGIRNLWVGVGVHRGVTVIAEAEVVNRAQPTLVVRAVGPTGRDIPVTGDTVAVPAETTFVAEPSGGVGAYDAFVAAEGAASTGDRVTVSPPPTGSVMITATLHDLGAGAGSTALVTRVLTVSRDTSAAAGAATAPSVRVRTTSSTGPTLVLESSTGTHATLRLSDGSAATWSVPGGPVTGPTAEVPVAQGATVAVSATTTAAQPAVLDCYFLFDHPKRDEGSDYARNPANTHTAPALDRDSHSVSLEFIEAARARRTSGGLAATTPLTVSGYASFEGDPANPDPVKAAHNVGLSERRRAAMQEALRAAGFTNLTDGEAQGWARALAGSSPDAQPAAARGSSAWWRARAVSADPPAPVTVTGELTRPAVPSPAGTDPRPARTARPPDCFHKLGARVEIVRDTFVRLEIWGEFDIETAAEAQLRRRGQPALRQGPRNPADGVCVFLLRLRLAEDRGSWEVSGEFRAKEGDLDGLAQLTESNANQAALDVLGALSILAPLTAGATELSPAAGAVVALGSVALGASEVIRTKRLTLRGAQVVVAQGVLGADGITTDSDRGTQVMVLLDVEVAFTFDLELVRVTGDNPVVTRYRAIGVRSRWETDSVVGPDGQPQYIPLPVFLPERGYTLDIPAGALVAKPPLDNVLRILGVRVSRDNPTYLEVEVGLGLDIGVITIDTVRVRARVDGPPLDLQLTKFGASIKIPNVLSGSGYVAIEPTGFSGSFDLQVDPLKLRASASLAVRQDPATRQTGVLLGIEVEFPVPLVLGNSGLGLFGLLGGVAVNHERDERSLTGQAKALTWMQQQFARPGGVMDPQGWALKPGHFGFAAGVLVGTLEGGYLIHLKGLVVVEVPGPRLLFVMKADVLKAPPVLGSNQSATFLAVLDLDLGRGTITIGIVAAYEIAQLLRVRVPVTAFFNTNAVDDWFIELGSYHDRVSVQVLDVISGSGYLMIHGTGSRIQIPGLPVPPTGLAVATGFHISAVLLGSKSAGLFFEVAAGFDAIVGFKPPFIAGKIYAKGELRLFIVSISASATLDVRVGKRTNPQTGKLEDDPYVHGEVCGSVDLFFFEVKGCVSLTIGTAPVDNPTPVPLIAGVSLVSRSPALVEGSGTDRAIDGVLGQAADPTAEPAQPVPTVPIDAIPVLRFAALPTVVDKAVLGGNPIDRPGTPANPWQRIGDRWWRYELISVELTGGTFLPVGGKRPSAWWTGRPAGEPVSQTALALLSWVPTAFSRAIPYGEELVTSVRERWGTVCRPAAPATPLLFTFVDQAPGPSEPGWRLAGIAWPDPPGCVRSVPAQGDLEVTEPWRSHDPFADLLQGTDPARVVGDYVPCSERTRSAALLTLDPALGRGLAGGPSNAGLPDDAFDRALTALAGGAPLGDVAAWHAMTAWSPDTTDTPHGCRGAILRSPVGDEPEPAPAASDDDRGLVKQAWAEAGFAPHPLRDAVRLTPSESLEEVRLLLLVPRIALELGLLARVEDSDGAVRDEVRVGGEHLVSTANPLPDRFADVDGPWHDPVLRAGRYARSVLDDALVPVWVPVSPVPAGAGLVVGYGPGADQWRAERVLPAFYVVAATGITGSELLRYDYDTSSISQSRTAVQSVLAQDPDDRALLAPGHTYAVTVTWRAAWLKQDGQPAATVAPTWQPNSQQVFHFATEPVEHAPRDLRPWLVASAPGPEETGVFCTQRVRLALASTRVAELFAAYGRSIQITVRAASGKHPEPPGGGQPGAPWTLPAGGPGLVAELQAADWLNIATPFEQALQTVLADPEVDTECVPVQVDRSRHPILTLPYDFEPLTDYLVDVHAVPADQSPSTATIIHRIGFTTSRFADLAELSSFVVGASVRERLVPTPAALQGLPDAPTGDQVDAAYQGAGLPVPQTPGYPAVELLWSGDPVPQPVAVVVECSEPLWRLRTMPAQVTGPADALDPIHTWWRGVPSDWLALQESSAPVAAGDLPRADVRRIIRCPGRTRALVLLEPGQRGTEVRLDLVVAADLLAQTPEQRSVAVRVSLARAPWEVED